ncbi:MAG: hypothetical protein M3387_03675, partial [Actinomycetota bacterium]|nr:hypothetical protein [Actinomycetota bacterium]
MRGRAAGTGLLGLVLAACTAAPGGGLGALPRGRTSLGGQDVVLTAALEPFGACDELLAYFQRQALERVGPYGLPGLEGGPSDMVLDAAAGVETTEGSVAQPAA